MNIRQAILKAADHIEQNPHLYEFYQNEVPECGTPGCMLGWIGHFLGVRGSVGYQVCPAMGLGEGQDGFIRKGIHELAIEEMGHTRKWPDYATDAKAAARLMRLWADRNHPAESRALIPASVRAIFTMTPEQLKREFQQPTAESLMEQFDQTIAALKR
jgi:hypothetical protein